MERDPPIEAIAAQIDETSAAVPIAFDRIERLAGMVFRVTGGEHHPVGRQQGLALGVQLVVGHQIVGEAAFLEPIDQVAVGLQMAQPGASFVDEGEVAGP